MPSVLYVEDTETMQNMYGFALKREGFDVTITGTAGEALARIDEHQYDIILLDMMLSGMSGMDFLQAANLRAKSPGTKIVVLSNVDNPNIVDKVRAFGVSAYLIKADYEPQTLVVYLKNLLKPTPEAK
ncbi:MAG: DNA-binding response regulator [Patescibacteria group bacterium]|nr:DNA-binding response regulator [Patescibacteria group bacterium]